MKKSTVLTIALVVCLAVLALMIALAALGV